MFIYSKSQRCWLVYVDWRDIFKVVVKTTTHLQEGDDEDDGNDADDDSLSDWNLRKTLHFYL